MSLTAPSSKTANSFHAVRTASPTDRSVLCSMIQAMAWESEGRELDKMTLQAGVQAVFDRPELGTYWLVTIPERVIACALVTIEWSDWNNAPYWWIQSLYILPEYRGQGVFECLLQQLELQAKTNQVAEIRLYVEKNNNRAARAYLRNGFDDKHYDCMIKPL